jgi:hypothetical protein
MTPPTLAASRALPRRSTAPPRRRGKGLLRLLAGLAIAASLIVAAGLHGMNWRDPVRLVGVQLGDVALQVPVSLIRPGPQRDGGPLSRLDLVLNSVDFDALKPHAGFPQDDPAQDDRAKNNLASLGAALLIAITPPDGIGDPASRLSDLHARFLEPGLNPAQAGLMMRRFRPLSPYAGEELFFAPPDGRLFWARCPAPAEPGKGLVAPVCLTELRRGGLDLQIRFDPSALDRWTQIEARLTALLAQLRRGADERQAGKAETE